MVKFKALNCAINIKSAKNEYSLFKLPFHYKTCPACSPRAVDTRAEAPLGVVAGAARGGGVVLR